MSQFKVGDLVKRVGGGWRNISNGDTSRVSDTYDGFNIQLEDFPGITFDDRKFELVAEAETARQGVRGFKVGDRVRMISESPAYGSGEVEVGDIGVIVQLENSHGAECLVDFPKQGSWKADFDDLEHEHDESSDDNVSLDVAVKSWQDASQQIKELQASLAGFERVMRKHGVKPL